MIFRLPIPKTDLMDENLLEKYNEAHREIRKAAEELKMSEQQLVPEILPEHVGKEVYLVFWKQWALITQIGKIYCLAEWYEGITNSLQETPVLRKGTDEYRIRDPQPAEVPEVPNYVAAIAELSGRLNVLEGKVRDLQAPEPQENKGRLVSESGFLKKRGKK